MSRHEPRPLAEALAVVLGDVRPVSPLARVQEAWPAAVGPAVAAAARPVAERGGVVTVACESAAWAQELELMSRQVLERLRRALGEGPGAGVAPRELKVVAGGRRRQP